MTDDRCIECGDTIEGDGTYLASAVKTDANEKLEGGDSVPVEEVLGFDDGPYCGLDCATMEDADE